jgi:hypothetical protein
VKARHHGEGPVIPNIWNTFQPHGVTFVHVHKAFEHQHESCTLRLVRKLPANSFQLKSTSQQRIHSVNNPHLATSISRQRVHKVSPISTSEDQLSVA